MKTTYAILVACGLLLGSFACTGARGGPGARQIACDNTGRPGYPQCDKWQHERRRPYFEPGANPERN